MLVCGVSGDRTASLPVECETFLLGFNLMLVAAVGF